MSAHTQAKATRARNVLRTLRRAIFDWMCATIDDIARGIRRAGRWGYANRGPLLVWIVLVAIALALGWHPAGSDR